MTNYAIRFLALALIAGILGFGGIPGAAGTIAKALCLVFLMLSVLSSIRNQEPNS